MHVRTGFHLMRNVVARSCVVRWDRAEARQREGNRQGSKVSAAQTQDTMSARRGGSSESLKTPQLHGFDRGRHICCYFTVYLLS